MNFSITVLGTSSAIPNSKRNPSAQVVNVHERFFLVDCGEGTQQLLRKNHIKLSKIHHIFISHLHGDHVLGLFGLVSTFSLLGRNDDLHIYSDPRLKEIIEYHNSFFGNELSYNIVFHDLFEGQAATIYEDDHLIIKTFPLKHSVPSHGFVFNEKERYRSVDKQKIQKYKLEFPDIVRIKSGEDFITESGEIIPNKELTFNPPKQRSYAYCSDTAYFPDIVPFIDEVDILYHEATFADSEQERAKQTMHSTAGQAAQIALQAKAKRLLLGHFSTRYKDINILKVQAKRYFTNCELAQEGFNYEIKEEWSKPKNL
ncbi:MAG: ribonuclease Z [Bacteroidales bacterium]|nr:ribonuclease Z [Bacteroidales bacterium]